MDLIIILVTLAFVGAAAYYIVSGISGEKKSYTVAYTVRLELERADLEKISVGDSVLSSDGSSVIGTVKAVNYVSKTEYVIDRRPTGAETRPAVTAESTGAAVTTTTAAKSASVASGTETTESSGTGTTVEKTETTAAKQQVIIVPGKDYGLRTGPLLSYSESKDTVIVYVTVMANVKASDNAYVVNGERVKIGKRAEFLTPYFYAVGEYQDIAASN